MPNPLRNQVGSIQFRIESMKKRKNDCVQYMKKAPDEEQKKFWLDRLTETREKLKELEAEALKYEKEQGDGKVY